MIRSRLGTVRGVAVVATASALLLGPPAGAETAAARPGPVVRSVGQIARQDVAPQPGSEPDTLVEPDVAVWPDLPGVGALLGTTGPDRPVPPDPVGRRADRLSRNPPLPSDLGKNRPGRVRLVPPSAPADHILTG